MAIVRFASGTKEAYNNLPVKDNSIIYFITDEHEIFKGEEEYSNDIIVVNSLPLSGQEQGVGYIVITGNKAQMFIWDGSQWISVSPEDEISQLRNDLNTHKAQVATSSILGHILNGGDISVDGTGLVTVTKLGGKSAVIGNSAGNIAVLGANSKFDSSIIPEDVTKAPINSPALTGSPTTPTPLINTGIANKEYTDTRDAATLNSAKEYTDSLIEASQALQYKGTIGDTSSGADFTDLPTSGYRVGWMYKVATAGTYAGYEASTGDEFIAKNNGPTSGSSVIPSDWSYIKSTAENLLTYTGTMTNGNIMKISANGELTDAGISASAISSLINLSSDINTTVNWVNTHKDILETYTMTQANLMSNILSSAQATAQGLVDTLSGTIMDTIDEEVDALNKSKLLKPSSFNTGVNSVLTYNGSADGSTVQTTANLAVDTVIDETKSGIPTSVAVKNYADSLKIEWEEL